MFDSMEFNYNINAVSGTLRKSHPKSKMTVRFLKDNLTIFNNECPKVDYGSREEIVVLQVMLIGEGKALVEYVLKRDFEEVAASDSGGD